jgi:hypothetical protein
MHWRAFATLPYKDVLAFYRRTKDTNESLGSIRNNEAVELR